MISEEVNLIHLIEAATSPGVKAGLNLIRDDLVTQMESLDPSTRDEDINRYEIIGMQLGCLRLLRITLDEAVNLSMEETEDERTTGSATRATGNA